MREKVREKITKLGEGMRDLREDFKTRFPDSIRLASVEYIVTGELRKNEYLCKVLPHLVGNDLLSFDRNRPD